MVALHDAESASHNYLLGGWPKILCVHEGREWIAKVTEKEESNR